MSQGVAFPQLPLRLHAQLEACVVLTRSHSLACSWKRVSIPGLGKTMQEKLPFILISVAW